VEPISRGTVRSSRDAREAILALVGEWVAGTATTSQLIERYWPLRRDILNRFPDVLTGEFGEWCGRLDTAIDAYADPPKAPYEIDETQLRREGSEYFRRLQAVEKGEPKP
jgi:hypothetical protein